TPVLDAGAVQELDVPITGGTLSVTGANGSRYTLVIPGDALKSPTRIRMQAVLSLTGAPAGIDAVHAVQFEPSGLQFMQPATLTIETASPVPLGQQAFFGYDGAGDDMHLVRSELGGMARLKVLHFSGYGMAMLAREQAVTAAFLDVVPKDAEARLQTAMAYAIAEANAGRIDNAQMMALIEGYMNQFEAEVLAPLRAATARSCANALTTLRYEIAIGRQRSLLGFPETTDPSATMKTARKVCFEEANQRCRVSGNVEELLVAHLGLARQFELLGASDAGQDSAETTAIDKCGRYELQFDSTLTYDGKGVPNPFGFGRLSVTTKVPLHLPSDLVNDGLEGEAEISHTETATRMNCASVGCSYYLVQLTQPGTAKVRMGVPRFTPIQSPEVWSLGKPVEQAGTFKMQFDTGQPVELIDVLVDAGPPLGIVNANRAGGLPPTPLSMWSSSYSLVNKDEIVGGWYAWDTGWTPASYPVMFERSTAPSFDNQLMHYVAISKLRLVHKPI
ncbi:MAG: hypothetical protein ABI460_21540, partial [Caldimonas sp.]